MDMFTNIYVALTAVSKIMRKRKHYFCSERRGEGLTYKTFDKAKTIMQVFYP
jgi:hypothetical protein